MAIYFQNGHSGGRVFSGPPRPVLDADSKVISGDNSPACPRLGIGQPSNNFKGEGDPDETRKFTSEQGHTTKDQLSLAGKMKVALKPKKYRET
jgi:hypothetical protein